jgi:hypothetical protein
MFWPMRSTLLLPVAYAWWAVDWWLFRHLVYVAVTMVPAVRAL